MKKVLTSLILSLVCTTAYPQSITKHPIEFVWPWASGSGGVAAMMRHLLEAANQQQDKYQFVWTEKSGAGGSIGANHVLSSNSLSILVTGDALYTRPMMYNQAHDVTRFRLITTICDDIPLALYSKKYTSVDQIRDKDVSVGVNPGTATQVLTSLLTNNNPNIKFTVIPYKGLSESITDLLGGHIDTTVAFVDSGSAALTAHNVSILGITGTRSFPGMPTFASQNIKGVDQLTNTFYIFAPRTLDNATARELNAIFYTATKSDRYKEACLRERGQINAVTLDQAEQLHQSNIEKWRIFTQGFIKQ